MEKKFPGSRKGLRYFLALSALLMLLSTALWFVLFRLNRFTLTVQLAGEREMTLEYGERYQEPGVRIRLAGTLFWKDGITPKDIQSQITGEVDDGVLGTYRLRYSASYLWFCGEAQRTVHIVDTKPPVITLAEETRDMTVEGAVYEEPGYRASDNYDGDITSRVLLTHSMGKVTYVAIDSSGNMAYVEREVPYYDPIPPEILLRGGRICRIPTGIQFTEPGFTARDNVDGDLTGEVAVSGTVDHFTPGIYPISYTVTDAYGNETVVLREVEVTAAQRPPILWPADKTIYLTFDDGPGPYTERLLEILDAYGVKATFFVVNSEYNSLMKEIVDRGHSIGIHSVTHNYAEVYASPEAYFEDLYAMQQIIFDNTGVRTSLMRFPGGSSNEVSIAACEGIMTFLTEAVQNAGFQYFDWNVDSDDAGNAHRAKTVLQNVIDGVSRTGISVVLQHDIHGYSVDAVEDIIVWGLNNGYTFLPLSPDSPNFHHPVNN